MAAVIAGSTVGGVLASEFVFLWVLYQRNQKHRGADNNINGDALPTPIVVPDPIVTPVLPSSPTLERTISMDSTMESPPSVVPPPMVGPHPIPTPILPSPPPSAWPVSTHPLNIQRTLTQSSRSAYEEEIERLRQEVLAQKNHITYIHEQMELTHIGSPPPSYRSSRRSDHSVYSDSSSTLPPLPALPSPRLVLDEAQAI
ncbi:hypothetical protein IW261DRAFT_1487410 [Armillaria novae-zelandiae]|uniref:Uncharacterized protein n=1 Tax=Armillaria novae-zelandiae TaxID=153914 RepID=A0AA39P4G0_9AGAR|nr:hypothetical protein IW261DRAFT_1487410 [Armillaria novae-zelandiae]